MNVVRLQNLMEQSIRRVKDILSEILDGHERANYNMLYVTEKKFIKIY